ncbi:hypothetical protein ACFQ6N_33300 [Kitasatospora sp. NPDC056446]|uniref:hypothetical protein n=1 Tax=Kitasatospora sp. NPDC056446 TaxID=3345819 RepID=UPI003678E5B4
MVTNWRLRWCRTGTVRSELGRSDGDPLTHPLRWCRTGTMRSDPPAHRGRITGSKL